MGIVAQMQSMRKTVDNTYKRNKEDFKFMRQIPQSVKTENHSMLREAPRATVGKWRGEGCKTFHAPQAGFCLTFWMWAITS